MHVIFKTDSFNAYAEKVVQAHLAGMQLVPESMARLIVQVSEGLAPLLVQLRIISVITWTLLPFHEQ